MLATHQARCMGEQGINVCKRREGCARYVEPNSHESQRLALLCNYEYGLFVALDGGKKCSNSLSAS